VDIDCRLMTEAAKDSTVRYHTDQSGLYEQVLCFNVIGRYDI